MEDPEEQEILKKEKQIHEEIMYARLPNLRKVSI